MTAARNAVVPSPLDEVEVAEAEADVLRTSRSGGTRWRLAAAALVIVALATMAWNLWGRPSDDGLTQAVAVLEDDRAFATATDAGVSLVQVSSLLQDAAEACQSKDAASARCDALFTGAAYSRVSGVSVLTCTRRGIAEARTEMSRYLETLQRDATAELPSVPRCTR